MASLLGRTNGFSEMAEMQLDCHRLSVVEFGCDFFLKMHPLYKPLMLIIIEKEIAVFFLRKGK